MQITKAEVIPTELGVSQPIQMVGTPEIKNVTAVFVRLETIKGESAWGCAVAHPGLTGETPGEVIRACQACAEMAPDLHPTNLEYSLAEIESVAGESKSAICAFDLAFHDLLGLATGLPLHQLLGGFRKRIQTSVTISPGSVTESVKLARQRANLGYRMIKIKGGFNPDEDVERVQAIYRALPNHVLRLDPDGGYTVQAAIEVARALEGKIEMLEQPTPADDLDGLRQVTTLSPIPILADQSVRGPRSVLALASQNIVDGVSVKVATCGGLHCASQVDAIARAGRLSSMVSCIIEPALLITAGLSFALGSPNVRYGDLDGHLELLDDPSTGGFNLEDGWLVASDEPGLGCKVNL